MPDLASHKELLVARFGLDAAKVLVSARPTVRYVNSVYVDVVLMWPHGDRCLVVKRLRSALTETDTWRSAQHRYVELADRINGPVTTSVPILADDEVTWLVSDQPLDARIGLPWPVATGRALVDFVCRWLTRYDDVGLDVKPANFVAHGGRIALIDMSPALIGGLSGEWNVSSELRARLAATRRHRHHLQRKHAALHWGLMAPDGIAYRSALAVTVAAPSEAEWVRDALEPWVESCPPSFQRRLTAAACLARTAAASPAARSDVFDRFDVLGYGE